VSSAPLHATYNFRRAAMYAVVVAFSCRFAAIPTELATPCARLATTVAARARAGGAPPTTVARPAPTRAAVATTVAARAQTAMPPVTTVARPLPTAARYIPTAVTPVPTAAASAAIRRGIHDRCRRCRRDRSRTRWSRSSRHRDGPDGRTAQALDDELQEERVLLPARGPLHDYRGIPGKTALDERVEAGDPGGDPHPAIRFDLRRRGARRARGMRIVATTGRTRSPNSGMAVGGIVARESPVASESS